MERADSCKLCFETFDETLRPRSLPCGHSFCTICLKNLIKDGKLPCSNCKRIHCAESEKDFPINYELEEMNSDSNMAQTLGACQDHISKRSQKMQTLINEQKASTENLLLVSEELQSQMKDYDDFLLDKKAKHEEVLQTINDIKQRNEDILRQIDNERKKMIEIKHKAIYFRKGVKEKLPSLNNATSTKSILNAIAELDESFADLEEWNESFQEQIPNAKLIINSRKVLTETMAAVSMVEADCEESIPEIPDLSKTNFTILEKIAKICKTSTLTVEQLQNMSEQIKNLLKDGRVYAIHSDSEKGSSRLARLSFEEEKMYLHCLQDGKPSSHVDVYTIQQSDLVGILEKGSRTMVFLDLWWDGIFQGRVHILLSPNYTPLARHFRILCTGDRGPSYAHSKFFEVEWKNEWCESIKGGDYEFNNGSGGASVIKGLNENCKSYSRTNSPGIVYATFGVTDGPKSAQFNIMTGSGHSGCSHSCVFGQVQVGLDVLKAATNIINVGNVEIRGCGVVLPL